MLTAPPPRIDSAIDAGVDAYDRSGGSWPVVAEAIRTHLEVTDLAGLLAEDRRHIDERIERCQLDPITDAEETVGHLADLLDGLVPAPMVSAADTMTRPRLLDLFCSDGGAGEGYRQAGFEVTGIDLVKRAGGYPCGTFVRGDALEALSDADYLRTFDAVHASPPCQLFTRALHLRDAQGKGTSVLNLLPQTLGALRGAGVPYVVENVPDAVKAGLRPDLLLCGSMFPALHVYDETGRRWLQRHRIFESNVPLHAPGPCRHRGAGVRPLGVYAGKGDNIPSGGQTCRTTEQGQALMGMPWAGWKSLTEAIPPAYTLSIGGDLIAHLATAEGTR